MKNPTRLFTKALYQLNYNLLAVQNIIKVEHNYIENWIKTNRPKQYKWCMDCFNAINTGVYRKYSDNMLHDFKAKFHGVNLHEFRSQSLFCYAINNMDLISDEYSN